MPQGPITTREQLGDFLLGLGKELWAKSAANANVARAYAIEQLGNLALVPANDPHYAQAARDTAQSILIEIGIQSTNTGDAVDEQRRLIFLHAVQLAGSFIPMIPGPTA